MGELILHIGTTKTGSTALQELLFKNRDKLLEHGIEWPIFTQQPGPPRRPNGIFINQYCRAMTIGKDPLQCVNDPEENLGRLAIALSSKNRTLLTDENFSRPMKLLNAPEYSPEQYWTTMADILKSCGLQHAKIIIYLRRQDDWAASQWRQLVKRGIDNRTALEDFCSRPSVRIAMDYAGTLEAIETAFGKAVDIIVRRYNRRSFEGGDIFHDFCAASRVPWCNEYALPEQDSNTSLSFDVTEALRSLSGDVPELGIRQKVLIPLARQLTSQNPDPPDTTPFDETTTHDLMEPFLAGNDQIANKYLNGEPLFSEEYGNRPVWVPDRERIAQHRDVFERAIRSSKIKERLPKHIRPFADKFM